ncbi:MAG: branched-chain amino acid transport system substrate-binding protein [Actinomycetota bacterium]
MQNRSKITALLLALGLTMAACGTRLPDSSFQSAAAKSTGNTTKSGALDTGTDAATGDVAAATGDASTGTGTGSSTGTGSGTGTGKTGGGSGPAASGGAGGANQASDVGITADSITIGNITAENGVLGDAFAPAARGLRAWTAAINAKGGINGRKVILKTCDDREDRSRDLACAQQLVEKDKVFAMVATNSRALGGASQYLNDKGVPTIGLPITNGFYRYPHMWSAYPSGYPRDGNTVGYKGQLYFQTGIQRWFKEHAGATKAAIFEYDINESKQAGDAFATGFRKEGYAAVTVYTVSFAAPSFDQAVAQMQREGTDIIMDSMDDGANRKLCDAMERRKFSVKVKASTIVSMGDAVGTNYNDTCRNSVYIPGESSPYTNVANPEIKAFRDAYAKYQPGLPVHQWALEAWAMANVTKEGIEKGGAAPTRKILEDYYRSLNKYSEKGIFVGLGWGVQDYSKDRAEHCFTMNRWQDSKGGWVQATDKFPFCYPDAFQYGSPALEQGN